MRKLCTFEEQDNFVINHQRYDIPSDYGRRPTFIELIK